MADTRFLYEVLVRGTPDGQIAGAHQVWARAFTDDASGEVVAVKHGATEVLNAEDVKALISANFVGTANQIATLERDLETANAQVQEANSLTRQHADRSADLTAALTSTLEEAAKVAEALAAAEATNRDMAAQIETLSAPPIAGTQG